MNGFKNTNEAYCAKLRNQGKAYFKPHKCSNPIAFLCQRRGWNYTIFSIIPYLIVFYCFNASLTGQTALLTEIFSNKLRLALDNGLDNGLGNEDEISNVISHIFP